MGYILWPQWKPLTIRENSFYSPQTDGEALLIKVTLMSLSIEKSSWSLIRSFTLLISVYGTGRHFAQPEEEMYLRQDRSQARGKPTIIPLKEHTNKILIIHKD